MKIMEDKDMQNFLVFVIDLELIISHQIVKRRAKKIKDVIADD
jgi:hypothetical protein